MPTVPFSILRAASRSLGLLVGLALASGLVAAPAWAGSLNPAVLSLVRSYPLDGRFSYAWRAGQQTDGVSQVLDWQGTRLAQPDQGGGVHCSGITFEVYVRALQQSLPAGAQGPSAALLQQVKEAWYVRTGDDRGPMQALVAAGLGTPILRVEDLQPGDFVQFWRNSGKGHSAIFTGHTRNRDGSIRGMIFWSAQGSSSGLGSRYVSVGPGEHQIRPGALYGVRATIPGEDSTRLGTAPDEKAQVPGSGSEALVRSVR